MKRWLLVFCFLFSIVVCGTIQAAVVVPGDYGGDTSISDLVVPGLGTYNVEFIYGTYDEIFGGGFDFPDPDDAIDAVSAIVSALNGEGLDRIHTTDLISKSEESFHIPTLDGTVKTAKGSYGSAGWWEVGLDGGWIGKDHMYADFEAVPIPPAVLLLGSGLVGLAGLRLRMRS